MRNRGGGSDDLRPDPPPLLLPSAKLFDDRLVVADHRAQWPGNKVEFVLDDQAWRRHAHVQAEQPPSLRIPWEGRELVDRPDDHGWRCAVDAFVDDLQRKAMDIAEGATRVLAPETDCPGFLFRRVAEHSITLAVRPPAHLHTAPGACEHHEGILAVAIVEFRQLANGIRFAVRGHLAAYPKPDRERLLTQPLRIGSPHEFEGANEG